MKPLISIIIPAHNEEKNIGLCISSLLYQAMKTKSEIIVVNDSNDDTKNILKIFGKRIKVIHLKKRVGVSRARNIGAKATRGDILAFIDADTIACPNWINTIRKGLEKNIALTGPVKPLFVERITDHTLFDIFSTLSRMSINVKPIVIGSNLACRKKAFMKIGGFRHIKSLEDIDFGFRLSEMGKISYSKKMAVYTSLRRIKASKLETLNYLINYMRLELKLPTKKLKDWR